MHATPSASHPPHTLASRLGWAIYLGVSWTWCIGMFLPMLLVRDFGWWAAAVFATPNVLGAAAMGFVIKNPERSRAFVATHTAAVAAFGVVTIAFHVFWLVWLGSWVPELLAPGPGALPILGTGAAAWLAIALLVRTGRETIAATLVWAVSGSLLLTLLFRPGLVTPSTDAYATRDFPIGLLYLAPVCLLGFACCPYLDATFHRARQHLGNRPTGTIGFGIGFILVFGPMIALTLCYAGPMLSHLTADTAHTTDIPRTIGLWILAHLALQAIFTIEVHSRELARLPVTASRKRRTDRVLFVATIAAAAAAYFRADLAPLLDLFRPPPTMPSGEVIYRVFMGAYALAFPLYVLLGPCARLRPTRNLWLLWGLGFIVAAPMVAMGTIAHLHAWNAAGVGVVVLVAAIAFVRPVRRVLNPSPAEAPPPPSP